MVWNISAKNKEYEIFGTSLKILVPFKKNNPLPGIKNDRPLIYMILRVTGLMKYELFVNGKRSSSPYPFPKFLSSPIWTSWWSFQTTFFKTIQTFFTQFFRSWSPYFSTKFFGPHIFSFFEKHFASNFLDAIFRFQLTTFAHKEDMFIWRRHWLNGHINHIWCHHPNELLFWIISRAHIFFRPVIFRIFQIIITADPIP